LLLSIDYLKSISAARISFKNNLYRNTQKQPNYQTESYI